MRLESVNRALFYVVLVVFLLQAVGYLSPAWFVKEIRLRHGQMGFQVDGHRFMLPARDLEKAAENDTESTERDRRDVHDDRMDDSGRYRRGVPAWLDGIIHGGRNPSDGWHAIRARRADDEDSSSTNNGLPGRPAHTNAGTPTTRRPRTRQPTTRRPRTRQPTTWRPKPPLPTPPHVTPQPRENHNTGNNNEKETRQTKQPKDNAADPLSPIEQSTASPGTTDTQKVRDQWAHTIYLTAGMWYGRACINSKHQMVNMPKKDTNTGGSGSGRCGDGTSGSGSGSGGSGSSGSGNVWPGSNGSGSGGSGSSRSGNAWPGSNGSGSGGSDNIESGSGGSGNGWPVIGGPDYDETGFTEPDSGIGSGGGVSGSGDGWPSNEGSGSGGSGNQHSGDDCSDNGGSGSAEGKMGGKKTVSQKKTKLGPGVEWCAMYLRMNSTTLDNRPNMFELRLESSIALGFILISLLISSTACCASGHAGTRLVLTLASMFISGAVMAVPVVHVIIEHMQVHKELLRNRRWHMLFVSMHVKHDLFDHWSAIICGAACIIAILSTFVFACLAGKSQKSQGNRYKLKNTVKLISNEKVKELPDHWARNDYVKPATMTTFTTLDEKQDNKTDADDRTEITTDTSSGSARDGGDPEPSRRDSGDTERDNTAADNPAFQYDDIADGSEIGLDTERDIIHDHDLDSDHESNPDDENVVL